VREEIVQQLGDADAMFGRQGIQLLLPEAIEIGDQRIGLRGYRFC
jgi:hypothetical protein